MRTKSDNGTISAKAISGTKVVILGLDVKGYELPEMMSKLSLRESAKKKPLFIGFSITRLDVETGKCINVWRLLFGVISHFTHITLTNRSNCVAE